MTSLRSSRLADVRGVVHGFFGRQGGVSEGIYASLNCGYGSNDNPARVRENRTRAGAELGTSEDRLLTVYQIHSAEAVVVTQPWMHADAPKADAMATNVKGLALGVLAADCAPVLFADEQAQVIGTAHAGWKGALGGVLESAVKAMETIGAERSRIRAAIGPCISQKAYEVGPEFYDHFLKSDLWSRQYFAPSSRTGHWRFNLPVYIAIRLIKMGVADAEPMLDVCTYENTEDYFSYRRTTHRGEPDYGRNLSAIMLAP